MATIEAIRHEAIDLTQNTREVAPKLPWESGLAQTDAYVNWYLHPKSITPPPTDEATKLLRDIAADAPFYLAVIFDRQQSSAITIPLPVLYEGFTEVPLQTFTLSTNFDFGIIVSGGLSLLSVNNEPVVDNVVLIGRNKERFAKSSPISMGRLRDRVQTMMEQKALDGYYRWIRDVKEELNHPKQP